MGTGGVHYHAQRSVEFGTWHSCGISRLTWIGCHLNGIRQSKRVLQRTTCYKNVDVLRHTKRPLFCAQKRPINEHDNPVPLGSPFNKWQVRIRRRGADGSSRHTYYA